MKAAVSRAFHAPLVIEDLSLAPPGPGEVEVAVRACAICHSDLIFIDGGWGGTLPAVWGHEAAGEIVALGAGVHDLAVGDRVAVTLIRSCGQCACCAAGQRTYCTSAFPLNADSPLRDAAGARWGHSKQGCGTACEAISEGRRRRLGQEEEEKEQEGPGRRRRSRHRHR